MPETIEKPEIVKTEGTVGGKARIKGTRMAVLHIVEDYEQLGRSPDEISYQYDLTVPQVLEALKYYYEHPEEIREEQRRRAKKVKKALEEGKARTIKDIKEGT